MDVITAIGGTATRVSVDNDLGFGAIIGLDIPVGDGGWLFQLNLRHISTDMEGREGTNRVDVDYDPTIFSIGFGYRF